MSRTAQQLLPLALVCVPPLALPAPAAAEQSAAPPVVPLAARHIAGTVYEDVAGDATTLGDPGVGGVALRLYRDRDDDGDVGPGDPFLDATVTDAGGDYSFSVDTDATGAHYLVVVDSRSIVPAAGLHGGALPDAIWAQQTYGDDPATGPLDIGPRFGGATPGVSDDFNAASSHPNRNRYQHRGRADVAVGNAVGVDFAFSFNVVTNARAGDGADDASGEARTVQGSLRQFLQNANAIAGANFMRFVPAEPPAGGGGSWWRIAVGVELPELRDAATVIDGTAYDASDGVTVRDINPGRLGSGGDVGVDHRPLPTVARPELEIVDDRNLPIGLDIYGDDTTVRRIAIYGFGDRENRPSAGNLRVNARNGTLLEECIIGAGAASFSDPNAGPTADNIRLDSFTSGTIRNNLIGYSDGNGIGTWLRVGGWLIEGNEIAGNAAQSGRANGISFERSGGARIVGNLIRDNGGAGFENRNGRDANDIENNTFRHNGIADDRQAETPGLLIHGSGNRIAGNVISDNFGAGVMVTAGASDNTITRNAIYANGTVTNESGDPPTGQIGIDLLTSSDDSRSGDPPYFTANDIGDGDDGGNGLLNFPVLEAATGSGSDLVLTGWARPGSLLELFIAAPDPSGFGEGQVYLQTFSEGSLDDLDTSTGAYGPGPINGIAQGQDNTHRFRFVFALPPGVTDGTLLTATATSGGATSEFSGVVTVVLKAPDITLVKSALVDADPINASANPKAIPGAVILNAITAINTGNAATDTDALALTDAIPAQTVLFVGDLTGPGSGPILYEDGATPGGLSFTFGGLGDPSDDVAFSNDGGNGYDYTPTPDADGYDTAVTHVRVTPAGAFAASDGLNHPSFTVKFRSRVR